MTYAVFIYSIPLNDEDGVNDNWVMNGEALAELLAQEGVQRKPIVMDEHELDMLEDLLELIEP